MTQFGVNKKPNRHMQKPALTLLHRSIWLLLVFNAALSGE